MTFDVRNVLERLAAMCPKAAPCVKGSCTACEAQVVIHSLCDWMQQARTDLVDLHRSVHAKRAEPHYEEILKPVEELIGLTISRVKRSPRLVRPDMEELAEAKAQLALAKTQLALAKTQLVAFERWASSRMDVIQAQGENCDPSEIARLQEAEGEAMQQARALK